MLRDSFYTVLKTQQKDLISFRSTVVINKDHEIFKGHFPAVPIVPGVCMLQMVKELLEERIRKPLQLTHSGNIKFLSVINPVFFTTFISSFYNFDPLFTSRTTSTKYFVKSHHPPIPDIT